MKLFSLDVKLVSSAAGIGLRFNLLVKMSSIQLTENCHIAVHCVLAHIT
jgi:hypothetical protein